jgi:hypothetical protein
MGTYPDPATRPILAGLMLVLSSTDRDLASSKPYVARRSWSSAQAEH